MTRHRLAPTLLALGLAAFASTASRAAEARSGGLASAGCSGCHKGGPAGMLTLTASPATFNPNDKVTFTLSLLGGFKAGGMYLNSGDIGDLQVIPNTGLSEVSSGLIHNQPKPASNGTVQFTFNWVAPGAPGAVRFFAYAVGANGNGNSSGDTPMEAQFDFVFGCSPQTFYLDGDSDGYGRDDFTKVGCENMPPPGFADKTGDCDDYRKNVFPGAKELCNMIDDNCDGQIDENAVPVELWPDADGDGYYDARTEMTGEPKIGCDGTKGWAAEPGDCQPNDPAVNPGAEEICNNIDDDCDGDIDERVRPTCGEGWCRREAPGCDLKYCMPGSPSKEKCNLLDDDCDGEIDEDPDMCPSGQICAAGVCVDPGSVTLDPSGGGATASSGSGGTGVSSGNASSTSGSGSNTPSGDGSGSTGSGGGSAGSAGQGLGGATSSGCALGTGSSHGALVLLGLLMSSAALRRRRRSARAASPAAAQQKLGPS